MDGPAKRLLREEDIETAVHYDAPSHPRSTPADLTLQLRNIGARVRRSVAQGYLTPPSHSSFTKYQSTNTIFRSENDTLRDVFAQPRAASGTADSLPNKRGRSTIDEATNATPTNHPYRAAMDLQGVRFNGYNSRPIKPLRNSSKTKSESVLTFAGCHPHVEEMAPALEAEEEDWSMMEDNPTTPSTPFAPSSL